MATRFYLPSSGAAAVSPGYNAGWESTSIAARLKAVTTKISSAMTTVSYDDANTSNQDILFRQYVSDPIAAQTISAQTVKLQMRCSETSISNNLSLTWAMYVFSNDGSTLRGTILAIRRDAVEAATSLTDRGDSTTSTEVVASANDRIVIEIGMGGDPSAAGSHDSSISIGDDSASDLPANDTETAAYNPWVEFANTITFASSEVTGAASITLDGVGISTTGTVAVAGAGSITGDTIGISASGVVSVSGAGAITLDGIGLSAAGTVGIVETTGAAAITLDGVILSATGAADVSGAAGITLSGVGLSATGAAAVAGAAAVILGDMTQEATGAVTITGTGAVTLDGLGIEAECNVHVTGDGNISTGGITLLAAGVVEAEESEITGAAAIVLEGVTISAAMLVYSGIYPLTLPDRSLALSVESRSTELTISGERTAALNLEARSNGLTLAKRSQALTLESEA